MLTQKSVFQLVVPDSDLARIQTNLITALNPVLATTILDGTLIMNVKIPANGKLVADHNLARKAVGAIVIMASALVSVPYALAADQTAPNGGLVLTFTTGAGATVNLWVF